MPRFEYGIAMAVALRGSPGQRRPGERLRVTEKLRGTRQMFVGST
jgi:hypothetical protein